MDIAPRLAMGVLGGEHARGETGAMQTADGGAGGQSRGYPRGAWLFSSLRLAARVDLGDDAVRKPGADLHPFFEPGR